MVLLTEIIRSISFWKDPSRWDHFSICNICSIGILPDKLEGEGSLSFPEKEPFSAYYVVFPKKNLVECWKCLIGSIKYLQQDT